VVIVRTKTIVIGQFFEFDVPVGFWATRWPYSDSTFDLHSRSAGDLRLCVDCTAPGLRDRPAVVDEEDAFQRWAVIFRESLPEDVVSKPFERDPDACVLPCWTFETQRPAGTYFCGAVIRNSGGVLAVFGSAGSPDIVADLRRLLKTIRAPTAPSAGASTGRRGGRTKG
jgi:hypothetical protein